MYNKPQGCCGIISAVSDFDVQSCEYLNTHVYHTQDVRDLLNNILTVIVEKD